jgi:protein CpxP
MTNLFTPLTRSFAIASLTGAALIAGSLAPATAQTPDSQKPPAAAAATSSKPETVEQRIATLKTALKITPDLEPKWTKVAQAMRDNASQMEKLVATKRAIPPE